MKRIAVDLFSGTGGATAAFPRSRWTVLTVDLERRFRPGIVADVRRLPLAAERPIDFLWASFPCTEFSDANPHRPDRPSLELLVAAFAAVRELLPRFWIFENVRGAIPFLGIPAQKIGPWCLWGYFPLLRVTFDMQTHRKSDHRSAVARAAIPRAFSAALLETVEAHLGVPSLLDLRPFRKHRHRRAIAGRPAQLGDPLNLGV